MEEIISATWTDDTYTTIALTIAGAVVASEGKSAVDPEGETTLFVPDDPANRYRQLIAQWEADGNTIAEPAASDD